MLIKVYVANLNCVAEMLIKVYVANLNCVAEMPIKLVEYLYIFLSATHTSTN
jgi:hypothetical protein